MVHRFFQFPNFSSWNIQNFCNFCITIRWIFCFYFTISSIYIAHNHQFQFVSWLASLKKYFYKFFFNIFYHFLVSNISKFYMAILIFWQSELLRALEIVSLFSDNVSRNLAWYNVLKFLNKKQLKILKNMNFSHLIEFSNKKYTWKI